MTVNFSKIYKGLVLILIIVSSSILHAQPLKVLFLGNSHTFWHDLPQITANLALYNGDEIVYGANTPGGCSLGHPANGHLFNSASLSLIDSLEWDYVILQEHSLFAVIDYYSTNYMYPGAKGLDSLIKLNYPCTRTVMQLIWGKKYGGQYCINGHCSVNFTDFSHMQDSLTMAYMRLTDTIEGIIAPTGIAWKESITNGDPVELFDPDESHPSLAGTYLSACVYYSILFQKPTEGITYTAGLNPQEALYLQQIADQVVFYDPTLWNFTGDVTFAGFEIEQDENTVYCFDTSIGATDYFWDFGDGTTDTTQNPSHTYMTNGTYTITQMVSSPCGADTTSKTVDIVIINMPDYNTDGEIRLIHEPHSNRIRIMSSTEPIDEIKVYGINGQVISSLRFPGLSEYVLNTANLPGGLYLISIQQGNKIETRKLIK